MAGQGDGELSLWVKWLEYWQVGGKCIINVRLFDDW
jgi:hypothetical protein